LRNIIKVIVSFPNVFAARCYEHLYSPRMVEEIKEKNLTSNKQTVIWPNYLNYSV